jgi:hypothetical protein
VLGWLKVFAGFLEMKKRPEKVGFSALASLHFGEQLKRGFHVN